MPFEAKSPIPRDKVHPGTVEDSFDRTVIGRLLLHGVAEAKRLGKPVESVLGLDPAQLNQAAQFVYLDVFLTPSGEPLPEEDEEEVMIRQVLLQNCSGPEHVSEWLASIIARRGMESNHLWEDMGLAERPDLTKLLMRHFEPLASKNTRNMRWKRFLYRSLCEAEGFSMCPSPTCDSCSEFSVCYGDESGEAVMARNNRAYNEEKAGSH